MNPIPEIKRFLLRALVRLNGLPCPDAVLDETVRHGVVPRPLQSDVNQAKRELEATGYLQGCRDEMDDSLSWSLTEKGRHKARQVEGN
jgi:hypothetical protein